MSKNKKPARFLKALLGVILALIILVVGAFLALTLTEYKPADIEAVTVPQGGDKVKAGQSLTIVSFNTGYAALGETEDFFMDGGTKSRPDSADVVEKDMQGIVSQISGFGADIIMLQEVDTGSRRSYNTKQASYYSRELGLPYVFACNYSSAFVPYPVPNVLGKVHSGLATYTDLAVDSASRVQLPVPFSWPVRCFNLKRCLLVSRMPVEGSDKELVIVNLHLEAYDDGEGKAAQTKMLYDFLAEEYAKGNYVIAGGDFNQTFPGAHEYPALTEGCWMPGVVSADLPAGFSFKFGEGDSPTCRLLDKPYKGNDAPQYYIIDGFIVSDNISVETVEVVDRSFTYSDHQPVRIVVTIAE